MQHIILALALLLFTNLQTHAQCNKKVYWYASKAEMLDESGQVADTKEDAITLKMSKDSIMLGRQGDEGDDIKGAIKESTCDWKDAFKNGKSVIKTVVTSRDGDSTEATFTIEAKDGKITLVIEMDKMGKKSVRIPIDKYEEK